MPVSQFPDIRAYHTAVQHAATAFTLPALREAQFTQDDWGPVLASGRSAVVFQAKLRNGSTRAVRCYTRQEASSRQRYAQLAGYVADYQLTAHVADVIWHEQGIELGSQRWPVLEMDWIEGRILDEYVAYLVETSQTSALGTLADRWRELIRTLQEADFAHGDLQHANVIVDDRGQLRLVDLDGVWIPPFSNLSPPDEIGHENYQHPDRTAAAGWGPLGDTFSALVIYLSLVALWKEPGLWMALYKGDNLIFSQPDFIPPFETDAWKQIARIEDPTVQALAQRLREFCLPGWVPTARLDGLLPARVQPWWEKVGPAAEAVSIPLVPPTQTLPEPPPLERQARSIPDPAVTVTRPEPARDGQGAAVNWWQKTGAEPAVTGKKAEVSKATRNDGLIILGVVSALITVICLAAGGANHASGAIGLGIVSAIASLVFFIAGFNPSSGKKP
jgi:eukaryotic-like serine/threonine-protein kinase